MPPALRSMWRLLPLGLPARARAAARRVRRLSLLAALPDALLALWLKLLGDGVLEADRGAVLLAAHRAGRVGRGDVVPAHGQHAGAAAVPRPGDDRARVARGAAAGVGRDDRAPRAARVPRPAVGAAQPGLRARPHVHVGVLDARLDPAAGRDRRPAHVDPPGARAARRVRAADGADVDVAAGRRARGARSAARQHDRLARHLFATATTAAPGKEVRVTGIGAAPGRRNGARRGSGGTAPVAAARVAQRGVAHAGMGRVRRRRTWARSCSSRRASTPPRATCCWCWPRASRLSAYIGATVGEIGFLRGIWLDGSRRLAWLEDYAASLVGRRPT